MTWVAAEKEWGSFLTDVETAQFELNCTWSNAWFRGLDDSSYQLLPSLLREQTIKWIDIPPNERPAPPDIKIDPNYTKVSVRRHQLGQKLSQLQVASKSTQLQSASINYQQAQAEYEKLKNEEKEFKARATRERAYRPLLRLGERDAFISYQSRAGVGSQNSWQTLAEMQHNGVPTRLLDWSDSLASGLFFALKRFRLRLEKHWFDLRKNRQHKKTPIEFPDENLITDLPTPALWILNPYYLARFSSDRDRIFDLTLDPHLDYYNMFIEQKKWSFKYPIPIYSPWRNQRIAAQRGTFVVWGYDRRALETILECEFKKKSKIAKLVVMKKMAAVYGVKHLRQLLGLDRFAMYRDFDALGTKVRREFLSSTDDQEGSFD